MDVEQTDWDWVSNGGEVKKKIIEKGEWAGSRPVEGAECKIKVYGLEGTWDSDLRFDEETTFVIGEGDSKLDSLLERCLLTMDANELSQVLLGDVKCNVQLLGFKKPDKMEYEYDIETSIKVATKHKEMGAYYFKKGKLSEAYSRYRRSIRSIIFAGKDEEGILPLYIAVCNNIALCHLKLNRPEDGITVCSKVLSKDEKNIKALLRRGQCYRMVKDFEKAYADIKKVLELEPNNPDAKKILVPLKKELDAMNENYQNVVKRMFSS